MADKANSVGVVVDVDVKVKADLEADVPESKIQLSPPPLPSCRLATL